MTVNKTKFHQFCHLLVSGASEIIAKYYKLARRAHCCSWIGTLFFNFDVADLKISSVLLSCGLGLIALPVYFGTNRKSVCHSTARHPLAPMICRRVRTCLWERLEVEVAEIQPSFFFCGWMNQPHYNRRWTRNGAHYLEYTFKWLSFACWFVEIPEEKNA